MVKNNLDVYEGLWWPLGTPEDRARAGTFTLGNSFTLRLLDPEIDWETSFHPAASVNPRLSGRCVYGMVTLLNCQIMGNSGVLGDIGTVDIHAQTALIGRHIPVDADPKFNRVSFKLTQLRNWAARGRFEPKFHGDGSQELLYQPEPVLTAQVPGGTVTLRQFVDSTTRGVTDIHWRTGEIFDLVLDERHTLDEIDYIYIRPLLQLLTLASGEASQITDLSVADSNVTNGRGVALPLAVRNFQGTQPRSEPEEVHGSSMRFTLQTDGVDFDAIIPRWFEVQSQVGSDCDLLFSLRGQRSTYIWNDFFNVASAIEGMHRKVNPELDKPSDIHTEMVGRIVASAPQGDQAWLKQKLSFSHQPSFQNRLDGLLAEAGTAASKFIGNMIAWRKLVKDYRNDVAHSLGKTSDVTDIERIYCLVQTIQILLEVILLRRLGFTDAYCTDLLGKVPEWLFLERRVSTVFPEFFTSASTTASKP